MASCKRSFDSYLTDAGNAAKQVEQLRDLQTRIDRVNDSLSVQLDALQAQVSVCVCDAGHFVCAARHECTR